MTGPRHYSALSIFLLIASASTFGLTIFPVDGLLRAIFAFPVWGLTSGYVILAFFLPNWMSFTWRMLGSSIALSFAVNTVVVYVSMKFLSSDVHDIAIGVLIINFSTMALLLWRGQGMAIARPSRWAVMRTLSWSGLLLFPLIALLSAERSITGHGMFHGGIVGQIMSENIPPEIPGIAGSQGRFYWIWQAYLATATESFSISFAHVAAIQRTLAMLAAAYLAFDIARTVFSARTATFAAYLMAFSLNIAGPITFLVRFLIGAADSDHFFQFNWAPVVLSIGFFDSMPLPSQYVEYLSIPPFCIAAACWVFVFRLCLADGRPSHGQSICIGLAVLGAALIHPTAGAATAAPVLGYIANIYWERKENFLRLLLSPNIAGPILAATIAIAISVPLTVEVLSNNTNIGMSIQTSWYSASLVISGLLLHLPLIAMAVLWRKVDRITIYCLTVLFVLLGASQLLDFQGNQFKFIWLAVFPAGLLAARGCLAARRRHPRFTPRKIIAILASLAWLNNAILGFGWAFGSPTQNMQFTSDGLTVAIENQPEKSLALKWARQNTELNAVLITWDINCDSSPVGTIAWRQSLYTEQCLYFHNSNAEKNARVFNLQHSILFPTEIRRTTSAAVTLYNDFQRPFYAMLIRSENPEIFDGVLKHYKSIPSFELVYETKGAIIARLPTR